MLLGERAGLRCCRNSSSAVSWSWRPGRGGGRGGGGGAVSRVQATPLAFTYILASWSWGRETQVGLEIPEEKEDIPQHLETKGPLAWVSSPCPTAWRSEQSDGMEVSEGSQGLRSGCLQHTKRKRSGKPSP